MVPNINANNKKNGFKSKVVVREMTSGKTLKEGKDYTLEYEKDGEAVLDGTKGAKLNEEYTVVVNGKGIYSGSTDQIEYSVVANKLPKLKGVATATIEYDGKEIILNPRTSMADDDYNFYLQSGKGDEIQYFFADLDGERSNYSYYKVINYTSNIKKGTAKITVMGVNGYAGYKTISFKIYAQPIDKTFFKYKN